MNPLERACEALEAVERQVAYSMELIRLVDGDHTYRISIGGQTYDFTDSETDDWNAQERLYEKLRQIKRPMAARAVLLAVRDAGPRGWVRESLTGGNLMYSENPRDYADWVMWNLRDRPITALYDIDAILSTGDPS